MYNKYVNHKVPFRYLFRCVDGIILDHQVLQYYSLLCFRVPTTHTPTLNGLPIPLTDFIINTKSTPERRQGKP